MPHIKYADAVLMALDKLLEKPDTVFVAQGAANPYTYSGGLRRLHEKYGRHKVVDYPLSEASMSIFVAGMALAGMKPILMFHRHDFMTYAIDGLVEESLFLHDMIGRQVDMSMLVWAIVSRGRQADGMHSANFIPWFMYVPKTEVYAPITAQDVYAVFMDWYRRGGFRYVYESPVLRGIEYEISGYDELDRYRMRGTEPVCIGDDVTIVSYSDGVLEAVKAARAAGVSADVIAVKRLKPLDIEPIAVSIEKTGRLLLVERGWRYCSVMSEVAARLLQYGVYPRKTVMITLPETTAPGSPYMEKRFFETVGCSTIERVVRRLCGL